MKKVSSKLLTKLNHSIVFWAIVPVYLSIRHVLHTAIILHDLILCQDNRIVQLHVAVVSNHIVQNRVIRVVQLSSIIRELDSLSEVIAPSVRTNVRCTLEGPLMLNPIVVRHFSRYGYSDLTTYKPLSPKLIYGSEIA